MGQWLAFWSNRGYRDQNLPPDQGKPKLVCSLLSVCSFSAPRAVVLCMRHMACPGVVLSPFVLRAVPALETGCLQATVGDLGSHGPSELLPGWGGV